MKKKFLAGFLIALMVLTLVPAYAYADLNSDLEDINNQKDQVSNDMAELEDSLEKQKAELDEIEAAVSAKEAEIADSEAEIQATKEKIEQTKKDIEKREKELGLRLRTMYKNGSVGYIDVILGSGSLSEFLSNVSMVQRLYRSDQEIMEELEKQQQLLEQQYAELERQQAALEEEKKALSAKQSEAEEKKASMQGELDALSAKLDELNADAESISAQIAANQRPDVEYEGSGKFAWPCYGTITSYFGWRIHPIFGDYRYHSGMDIAVAAGTPVVAAESGTVILAQWYGGYGNCVVIDHGGGISTLYGHNNSLNVSVGQQVSKGQTIAAAGSTGDSTGPHCHFEVRVNGVVTEPLDYLS